MRIVVFALLIAAAVDVLWAPEPATIVRALAFAIFLFMAWCASSARKQTSVARAICPVCKRERENMWAGLDCDAVDHHLEAVRRWNDAYERRFPEETPR